MPLGCMKTKVKRLGEKELDARKRLSKMLHFSPLFLLIMIIIILFLVNPSMFTSSSVLLILQQSMPLIILALGNMMVLMSGGMDMSAAQGVAFYVMVFGMLVDSTHSVLIPGILTVLVAIAVGLFNGIFIGIFNLPSFFVTLASMSILQGLALVLSSTRLIILNNKTLKFLASGYVGFIPSSMIYAAIIAVFIALIMRYTRFGANVCAIGSNLTAAKVNGVNITNVQLKIYALSAAMAVLTSILLTARASVITPGIGGATYLLDAVAATIIGGTSIVGGRGNVAGTIVGAIIISLISYCITALGIQSTSVDMFKGLVVVFALCFDTLVNKYGASLERKLGSNA